MPAKRRRRRALTPFGHRETLPMPLFRGERLDTLAAIDAPTRI